MIYIEMRVSQNPDFQRIDINTEADPAIQARKYGWNAKHKVSVLTNFEYFIIYDTTSVPKGTDDCQTLQKVRDT